jgi:hypothetical protein
MLHQKALVDKETQTSLKGVLDEAVKMTSHIQSKPLNARLY